MLYWASPGALSHSSADSRAKDARKTMFAVRYRRILFFFASAIASLVFWEAILPRLGLRRWAERTRPARLRRVAANFRKLAIRMGGVLIKVGQFFSSRLDVFPEEITSELSGLQDEVPAENFSEIRRELEAQLGPLAERFASFEQDPLAAASLGQVHRARLQLPAAASSAPGGGLRPGEEGGRPAPLTQVVVKIQRPQIERIIAVDLAALRTIGNWLHRYEPIRRRVDIPSLLQEFTRILYEELDYLAEGRNAEIFAENFRGDSKVRVPRVVWSHTTRRVLTLEDVYAIKITDYASIEAAGVNRAEVADRLFHTYLKQVFEDGFFHADPHPGNLFVSPLEVRSRGDPSPSPWQLTFVDFGMAGRMPRSLRTAVRELAISVGTRDTHRMVQAYQSMGILLPGADLALLERAQNRVLERFWGKSMEELRNISHAEMHELMGEFRELIYDMPFQIPQDLILLVRAVSILSGMCTGLDPAFNVWQGIEPFAQKLLAEEAGTRWERLLEEGERWGRILVSLPSRFEGLLTRIERGELDVGTPDVTRAMSRVETTMRKMVGGIVFAALLVTASQLYLSGHLALSYVLFGASAIALLWVVLSR